tara:strand:+ start:329 stop:721 length:393 start_codon:yes stop_codon:yes gene_type:complete
MLSLRGYIFSRSFMGERVPQNIQNLLLREYCLKNNFNYLLSMSEYAMNDSSAMLYDAIMGKDNDGIVAYSLFQMPYDDELRESYLKKIIKEKKIIHFALEDLSVEKKEDIKSIDEIWLIKKSLDYCITSL